VHLKGHFVPTHWQPTTGGARSKSGASCPGASSHVFQLRAHRQSRAGELQRRQGRNRLVQHRVRQGVGTLRRQVELRGAIRSTQMTTSTDCSETSWESLPRTASSTSGIPPTTHRWLPTWPLRSVRSPDRCSPRGVARLESWLHGRLDQQVERNERWTAVELAEALEPFAAVPAS